MRADTLRTRNRILDAADAVLRADPSASLEQIAEYAGVARTTVHRRFSSREALLEALRERMVAEFARAVEASRIETAPPAVALHQLAVNLLGVKTAWPAELLGRESAGTAVVRSARELMTRARADGLLRPDVDVEWAASAFLALLRSAAEDRDPAASLDDVAARVTGTLLQGLG